MSILSIRALRVVIREGAVRGLSYPFSLILFESMYSHVYGAKWSPWSVPFKINYLREGVRVLKYPISLIFYELDSI